MRRVPDMRTVVIDSDIRGLQVQWDAGGTPASVEADMVVLVTGTMPSEDSRKVQEQLEIVTTSAGFAAPAYRVLRPTQTSLDGIFMAGAVGGGCRISRSVMGAGAAVGSIMSKLIPGKKLTLKSIVAHADEELCSACGLCVQVCPFSAVQIDKARHVAVVNEVLCQGCGTCVGTCPSGAALSRHFTDAQLEAEIKEVLHE